MCALQPPTQLGAVIRILSCCPILEIPFERKPCRRECDVVPRYIRRVYEFGLEALHPHPIERFRQDRAEEHVYLVRCGDVDECEQRADLHRRQGFFLAFAGSPLLERLAVLEQPLVDRVEAVLEDSAGAICRAMGQ